jgi:hypothetical protein
MGVHDIQPGEIPMHGTISTTPVECHHDVEQFPRRRIAYLWVTLALLSFVLPPCAYPKASGSTRPGLGVNRATIQSVFARQAFAFKFEAPYEGHGPPRVTGTVPGKLIVLTLMGPRENLTEVTLTVGVPSTNPQAPPAAPQVLAENERYLRAVLQQVMPDWKDGVKWLNAQLQRSGERLEAGLRIGQREIVLFTVNRQSMVLLSIRAGQPSATRGS